MQTLTEAQAIKRFSQLMKPFITWPPATAQEVVDEVIAFYHNVRIADADDCLMLEWGSSRPHLLFGFTDLRGSQSVNWGEAAYQWLGLSRQVLSDKGDDAPSFCAYLYFDKADGTEPSSGLEFQKSLEELDSTVAEFASVPYVARLLASKPSQVNGFISEMG